ncbi:hypothetical protein AQUCO_00900192v1 [Aquilegia coerulea]|uniref:Uncharacterized protein n=1 Tax=Aquilegia coerulea TaxID=218851 RepID=A0A2G5ECF0_AQUCA|nr:hypothetical protein AQUCO_00900192v1 [Aquilegia coerulea]
MKATTTTKSVGDLNSQPSPALKCHPLLAHYATIGDTSNKKNVNKEPTSHQKLVCDTMMCYRVYMTVNPKNQNFVEVTTVTNFCRETR